MGLKEQLKKLVTAQVKESAVSTEPMKRIRRQADAAKQTGRQIRSEKE